MTFIHSLPFPPSICTIFPRSKQTKNNEPHLQMSLLRLKERAVTCLNHTANPGPALPYIASASLFSGQFLRKYLPPTEMVQICMRLPVSHQHQVTSRPSQSWSEHPPCVGLNCHFWNMVQCLQAPKDTKCLLFPGCGGGREVEAMEGPSDKHLKCLCANAQTGTHTFHARAHIHRHFGKAFAEAVILAQVQQRSQIQCHHSHGATQTFSQTSTHTADISTHNITHVHMLHMFTQQIFIKHPSTKNQTKPLPFRNLYSKGGGLYNNK